MPSESGEQHASSGQDPPPEQLVEKLADAQPVGPPVSAREGDEFFSDRPGGLLIPGYELLRELSRGGQGVVYQAIQSSTKRKVAVKILLEGPYASKLARRHFEREVELVSHLKHPNIISVFDSGVTADGQLFYVMEYVRGTPVTQYVRDQKLGLEQTLKLFAGLCDAVNHAHQKAVIHRDLKPNNILVDGEGNLKILDFGLAKAITQTAETLATISGQVMGTLPYMSPEQTKGNPDLIDTRTDVYALGVVLYEMLTGAYPYPVVGEMAEVLRHISQTEPSAPSRLD
jgi:serine/threonine protein kinase